MQKLTKREKKLIYILLCIIIVSVGVFLLILPAQSRLSALKQERDALANELKVTKNAMIDYGDTATQLANAQAILAEQEANFYRGFVVEDVDALLTKLALNYGLTPISMEVNDVSIESVISYDDYVKSLDEESKNEEVKGDEVQVYNVSMILSGSIVNVQKLVSDANTLKSLRVSGVNYSTAEDGSNKMTVTFKLYLI